MDLDIEDLDKLYESIEAQNIEIIDDLSMLDVDDVNFDLGETPKSTADTAGVTDDKNITIDDPVKVYLKEIGQGSVAHPRGGDRTRPSESATTTPPQSAD